MARIVPRHVPRHIARNLGILLSAFEVVMGILYLSFRYPGISFNVEERGTHGGSLAAKIFEGLGVIFAIEFVVMFVCTGLNTVFGFYT
ncbi:hypothetical protein EJ08DRAFT_230658 [Tothia fuscella]|uniref:Uncharacterized protein n=1 Tax=Tothia fuscella TaxID=1048955 RepID=A0A9P4U3Q9_9PEZI|nr:hypothetical protein EJ08DRAFT_230658 [Tothia fuscella]